MKSLCNMHNAQRFQQFKYVVVYFMRRFEGRECKKPRGRSWDWDQDSNMWNY